MICVEHVTKTYGGFTAVDDVSFTARPGRVTGLMGPNGAGKSTTLRVVVGLTHPTTAPRRCLDAGSETCPTPAPRWASSSTRQPSTPAAPAGKR
jgi:ABC-2 type transport system ATP-binding protein